MTVPGQPVRAAQAEHLHKIKTVLDRLQICRATFYLLVRERKLRVLKINGASRVLASDVDAYIASLPAFVPPAPEAE